MLPTAASTTPLSASLACFCSHSAKFHPPSPCVPGVQLAGTLLQATSNTQPGWDISVKIASVLYAIGRAVVPGGKSPSEQRRTQVTSQHRSFWQSDLDVGIVTSLAKLPHLLPAPLSHILILSKFNY